MDALELEMKSSATTLSDMEVFIFPQLMYGLVLANIMSPCLWRWRDDPWFAGAGRMTKYRRMTRLKQYIMDHYAFNLDLDTWGLTTKEKEIARFKEFLSPGALAQSNALFGYEGDKYYFDMDIRSHFGLDKYEGNIIPYWKTETVEAMTAFRHRPGYAGGAGECVSLAALYAAALFIVARVPLKDIYMMATPLHSQNYVDLDDGVLTNNRRLVTKAMWFNGTELSAQARRALEHERVTLVAHETGWIHTLYDRATIAPATYSHFTQRISNYLKSNLTDEILGNFVRNSKNVQKCFQLRATVNGREMYIGAERAFAYEEECSYRVTDATRPRLLAEIEAEEFCSQPLSHRIVLNDLESFVRENKPDIDKSGDMQKLREQFACDCLNAEIAIESLVRFCNTRPRLPDAATKHFEQSGPAIEIHPDMSRADIIARLESIRTANEFADLAFHAYRDLNRTAWEPFVKAAVERSPVSVALTNGRDIREVIGQISKMPNESIYEGAGRLAQPDEVWNYGRGDGVERALLVANLLRSRAPKQEMNIEVTASSAVVVTDGLRLEFPSAKELRNQVWLIP